MPGSSTTSGTVNSARITPASNASHFSTFSACSSTMLVSRSSEPISFSATPNTMDVTG